MKYECLCTAIFAELEFSHTKNRPICLLVVMIRKFVTIFAWTWALRTSWFYNQEICFEISVISAGGNVVFSPPYLLTGTRGQRVPCWVHCNVNAVVRFVVSTQHIRTLLWGWKFTYVQHPDTIYEHCQPHSNVKRCNTLWPRVEWEEPFRGKITKTWLYNNIFFFVFTHILRMKKKGSDFFMVAKIREPQKLG